MNETESDVVNYQASLRKSESFKPLNYKKYLKNHSDSTDSDIGSKSIQGRPSQDFENGQNPKRNPSQMSMKTVGNKSHKRSEMMKHKSASKGKKPTSFSKTSSTKKGKTKRINKERMNIVPFNGYVPDIIQNEFCNSNQ